MSPHPTAPEPDPEAAQRAANAQYYLRVLHRLIDIGVTMVEQVAQQALPQNGAAVLGCNEIGDALAPAPDPTPAYDRVTRSIRRSIMLARAIQASAPAPAPSAVQQNRVRVRKRVIRAVEDSVERSGRDSAQGDALRAEMFERLDSPDMDDDIDHRPLEAIIDEIRHDLGLTGPRGEHFWKRRTPADVAALSARAAAPLDARPAPTPDRAGWAWHAGADADGPMAPDGTRVAVRDG
jgi:hypothetical protein